MPVERKPSLRLVQNCAHRAVSLVKNYCGALKAPNTDRPDSLTVHLFCPTHHVRARYIGKRNPFNPHRARSGSVQRILSAMLRQQRHLILSTSVRSTADRILSTIANDKEADVPDDFRRENRQSPRS